MADAELHPNARRVTEAAAVLVLDIEVRSYPAGTRTAQDDAAAVGCDVGQIVKSLIFLVVPAEGAGTEGDGAVPVLALVSGRNLLDETRLAAAAGAVAARRCDAATVRSATGFAIGGVPPFGFPAPLPTFIDEDLLAFDEVWAAAGTPRDNFAVSPARLVAATGGTVASLRQG
jgi:prolyl-tRNA editing enzyme YbaK/EbsC (Cys-tRNA(Pro) deacylase)